mmetsp:Transcript_40164/g.95416  ORF Transcript_40164/g.95416 Transcript_40164/m.95416 type:complete len:189 (-) Transcript_40164:1451-2017(-)
MVWDIQSILDTEEPFVDIDFPPNDLSLGRDWESLRSPEFWSTFEWRRSTEIYGAVGPFEDRVRPDDIAQGALGDCYLLGAASMLAEDPERVKRLFLVRDYNKAGIYAVRLFWEGTWETVVVDNYFPYCPRSKASGIPCFVPLCNTVHPLRYLVVLPFGIFPATSLAAGSKCGLWSSDRMTARVQLLQL